MHFLAPESIALGSHYVAKQQHGACRSREKKAHIHHLRRHLPPYGRIDAEGLVVPIATLMMHFCVKRCAFIRVCVYLFLNLNRLEFAFPPLAFYYAGRVVCAIKRTAAQRTPRARCVYIVAQFVADAMVEGFGPYSVSGVRSAL